MKNQFINFNGTIIPSHIPLFTISNRAFCYGDGLFETIRVMNSVPLFLTDHIQRLTNGMKSLKMNVPDFFSPDFFKQKILELTKKNKLQNNLRVRLQIFRNGNGLYTPESNDVSYCIQVEKLPDTAKKYFLNKKGFKVDVYEKFSKPISEISNLKTCNALYYILAGLHKKEKNLDDCLLLNYNRNIAEASSSNIFIVRKNIFFTPSLKDGCVAGVMRKQIIELLKKNKKVIHECSLSVQDLLKADEIFLTNIINGIRWVEHFRGSAYRNTHSKWIAENLLVK